MVNKVRENAATWSSSSVSSAGVSCSITPWATIQLNPTLLPPCLSSSLVPLPRGEQCFSILSALSATYSILYTLSYSIYPCARVSARYSQPRSFPGFFPFNFLVFLPLCLHQRYQSLYLYLRPSPPLPRILTSDCNFGSFVSSSLGNLLFSTCPLPYLLFQSRTLYRSFLHSPARLLRSQFSGSSSSRRVPNLNFIPFFISHFFLPFGRT